MLKKIYEKLQTREGITFVASLALIVLVLGGIVSIFRMGGRHHEFMTANNGQIPMIRVSGTGEMNVSPDVATFSVSVSKDAVTIADARNQVAEIGNGLIAKLKDAGISEKDIKTDNVSTYPKYENRPVSDTRCASGGIIACPPSYNSVIVGYTVSTSYSVKVRDLDNVSKIATLLTDAKIFTLQGPNFSIDDEQKVQDEARAKAIDSAKTQARVLADQLGVRLGKIIDFQADVNDGIPVPMYARAMDSIGGFEKSVVPELPTGETKITSRVTITYTIR